MEFIPILTTVYTLAIGINAWLDERAETARTIREISATISRIQNILLPLRETVAYSIQVDQPVLDAVRSIGEALKRTQEHLLVWDYRRTRQWHAGLRLLAPSNALGQLKADVRLLDQQMILLLAALAVVQYSQSHSQSGRPASSAAGPSSRAGSESSTRTGVDEARPATVLDWVKSREVKEFWRGYVGEKIQFIPEREFHSRLGSWLGEAPSSEAFGRLMLRLDEFGVGGVTPLHLDEISAGGYSLRDVLKMYMETDEPVPNLSTSLVKSRTKNIKLPLLVWIDDNPINNTTEVSYARKLGINVIQLTSTALAKAWIEEHTDFLRQNDHPSSIRFISDNHRDEHGPSDSYLNYAAGQNILRYLRGRHYNAPVLIYTGQSIQSTHYVTKHDLAGSTVHLSVCCRYISSLAAGGTDDFKWTTFMAV